MAIRPRDLDEFFKSLGAKRVEKCVINRELSGGDLNAAKAWLEGHRANRATRVTIVGIALASLIGLLAAAASYLAP